MCSIRYLALGSLLLSTAPVALRAQWDADVPGRDTCRPIWREYGRSMRGRPRAVYCEVREIGSFKPTGTIEVDGEERNGVSVRGVSSRADARVRLVIQAQGRTVDDAKAIAERVTLDLSKKPLRVEGIDRRDDDDELHFVVATILLDAPERANLWLRVNYAPMEVEGVKGQMDLRAAYGPLKLVDLGGDVRARVEHGPITVELSESRWDGVGLDAEAEYGPMTLRVPRDFSADLTIGARNGPLDIDFPLTLSRLNGSMIETKLGSGGPRVRAIADYGPMSLQINR